MIEPNVSHPPRSSNPSVGILRLQRILATPLALVTVGLLLAAGIMVSSIARGEFQWLAPLLAVVATGCILGLLSTSLFRGRGVPQWFLRGLWLAMVVYVASAFVIECLRMIKGQQVDLGEDILLYGPIVYAIFSLYKVFWIRKLPVNSIIHPTAVSA